MQALKLMVAYLTVPPHQYEYRWVLYEARGGKLVAEGYARSLDQAVADGKMRRAQIMGEANASRN